jgi:hypothetical protein
VRKTRWHWPGQTQKSSAREGIDDSQAPLPGQLYRCDAAPFGRASTLGIVMLNQQNSRSAPAILLFRNMRKAGKIFEFAWL